MTSDFWSGFWVWLLAFGIPILIVPIGWIFGAWPQASGRYGRSHLRWFKFSVLLNVIGLVMMVMLWLTTTMYLANLQVQQELALRKELQERFTKELEGFTTTMQGIAVQAAFAHESVVAAEDALMQWYDRVEWRQSP